MTTVIQEDTVRQLHLKQKVMELHVTKDTYVTLQTRDYIREKGMRLIVDDAVQASVPAGTHTAVGLPENKAIRPAKEMAGGRFVTQDGRTLDHKPEQMTHLHGNLLVAKNHPRILLRGMLDDLEADILMLQAQAHEQGMDLVVKELGETLDYCRAIMSSEVTEKSFTVTTLLGMDEARQREISHQPARYLGIGHLMPDHRMGAVAVGLNKLRTKARQTELAAVTAFCTPDGKAQRVDLIQALNRLSSTFYIMMLRLAAEKQKQAEEDPK